MPHSIKINPYQTSLFIIILSLLCSNVKEANAVNIHSSKTIRLKEFSEQYAVNIGLDSTIASFGLREIRGVIDRLKRQRHFKSAFGQNRIRSVLSYLGEDHDYTLSYQIDAKFVSQGEAYMEASEFIMRYVFPKLTKRGHAKLLSKVTMQFEQKLVCTHYKVDMAGERHEGYQYKLLNGFVFYTDFISI
jgi:hypothetical protein